MDRRRFLTLTSAALLTRCPPLSPFVRPTEGPAADGPVVFETNVVSYESISSLFDSMGGLRSFLSVEPAVSTIVVKPNICLPDSPQKGTTTSPDVVDLICRRLIKDGVQKIVIADHTLHKTGEFERTPWHDLPKKYPEVKLLLANEERLFEPLRVDGRVLATTDVLRLLRKADLLINVPTAKHHSATHVSLGVKNLMGVIWDRSLLHTTMDLDRAIADLARAIKPPLTIIDASRVLLNGGPTGPGRILAEQRLFASRDVLAVDAVVSSRYPFGGMNILPPRIAHLQAASEVGVGEIDIARISLQQV